MQLLSRRVQAIMQDSFLNTKVLLYSAGVVFAAAGALVVVWFYPPGTPELALARGFSGADVTKDEQLFRDYIQTYGGTRAYEAFAKAVEPLSPGQRHTLAHAFGGALYQTEGTSSLPVCDSRFSYGCFHQFLGEAIGDLGLGVVDNLNRGCIDTLKTGALSCQHGIGHGVLAYLGYSPQDLDKALAVCKNLPFNDPIGGCYGGVFMEYNLETMRNIGEIRQVVEGNMQTPCPTLDSAYKPACYFWQPQWWAQVLRAEAGDTMPDLYARVGALCRGVPEAYRRDCFEGLGTNLPGDANFDPAEARRLCEAVSPSPLDQLYCKSLAANSLSLGGSGQVADGLEACSGLSGEFYDYCSAYAKNEANIANVRARPTQ